MLFLIFKLINVLFLLIYIVNTKPFSMFFTKQKISLSRLPQCVLPYQITVNKIKCLTIFIFEKFFCLVAKITLLEQI